MADDFPLDVLQGSLHAAEHGQIAVLPLIAMCDRWDIGGLSTAFHSQTGRPTIFIYDGHPGGVGITRMGFERFERLVADALRLIGECPCRSGCPSCVQSPKCGNLNEPLNKNGATRAAQAPARLSARLKPGSLPAEVAVECSGHCQPPWPCRQCSWRSPPRRQLKPVEGRSPRPRAASRAWSRARRRRPLRPQAGAAPSAAKRRNRARTSAPQLVGFSVSRSRLYLHGRSVSVRFRIDGRSRLRDVRVYLTRRGARTPAGTIRLGPRPRGRTIAVALTGVIDGRALDQGAYTVRVAARDSRERRLRIRAGTSSTHELAFLHHRFPIAGRFTYGSSGSRFGAPRSGHSHQGQDLAAASGTPLVAPRAGTIEAVQYQARGAGHYVVLDSGDEDRDYVFMHLLSGSVTVREGQSVRTGQRIGAVGSSGASSGPHLHFEIWTGGGWYTAATRSTRCPTSGPGRAKATNSGRPPPRPPDGSRTTGR